MSVGERGLGLQGLMGSEMMSVRRMGFWDVWDEEVWRGMLEGG
jgi:hypothetical protein